MLRLSEVDARLRPLVRRAVEAKVPQPRIVELTGLARNRGVVADRRRVIEIGSASRARA